MSHLSARAFDFDQRADQARVVHGAGDIGVIGVGGVGGYFGAKLCRLIPTGRYHVSFVARGEHLRAIQESGLLLDSESDGSWGMKRL